MNLFDGIQSQMFDTVTDIYGYDGVWVPSSGGSAITGRVLLKEAAKEYDLNDVPFTPEMPVLEWKQGVLPGLYEAVREKKNEYITIGTKQFWLRTAAAKYDGKTYYANLERK